jgi:hypothetical protein
LLLGLNAPSQVHFRFKIFLKNVDAFFHLPHGSATCTESFTGEK